MKLAKLTTLLWILTLIPYLAVGQKKAKMDHILRMSEYAHEQKDNSPNQRRSALADRDIKSLKSSFKNSLDTKDQSLIHAIVEFTGTRSQLETNGVQVGSQIGSYFTINCQLILLERFLSWKE